MQPPRNITPLDAPPPVPPRIPRRAAVILAAGVLAAMAILVSAVRDSTPPPLDPLPVDQWQVVRLPDDPANPNPTMP